METFRSERFAYIMKWLTMCMLFCPIDFKSAFTQATLSLLTYFKLAPSYQKATPQFADNMMKLTTSLSGNKQAVKYICWSNDQWFLI